MKKNLFWTEKYPEDKTLYCSRSFHLYFALQFLIIIVWKPLYILPHSSVSQTVYVHNEMYTENRLYGAWCPEFAPIAQR